MLYLATYSCLTCPCRVARVGGRIDGRGSEVGLLVQVAEHTCVGGLGRNVKQARQGETR